MPRPILKLDLKPLGTGTGGSADFAVAARQSASAAREWLVTEIEAPFKETPSTFQSQRALEAHLASRGLSGEDIGAFLETKEHLLTEGHAMASEGLGDLGEG